jgi:hypothetical protein
VLRKRQRDSTTENTEFTEKDTERKGGRVVKFSEEFSPISPFTEGKSDENDKSEWAKKARSEGVCMSKDKSKDSLFSSKSRDSLASSLSIGSIASFLSYRSIASAGSILSIASTGSILSIASTGSILSIGSFGSILSIFSVFSILRAFHYNISGIWEAVRPQEKDEAVSRTSPKAFSDN